MSAKPEAKKATGTEGPVLKEKKPQEAKIEGARPKTDKPAGERKEKGDQEKRERDGEKGERKPRETKDGEKGERKPRENRDYKVKDGEEPREKREYKVKDGEEPREKREYKVKDGEEPREERAPGARGRGGRTADGKPRERPERKERVKREFDKDWKEKLEVNLQTELPPMPKEVLQKPNKELHEENLKFCDRKMKEYQDEIDQLREKREKWNKDQVSKRMAEREEREKKQDEKKDEWEGNKHLFEDHKTLKNKLEKVSKKRDDIEGELKTLQVKLLDLEKQFVSKGAYTTEKVQEEIDSVNYKLNNERLMGSEEAKLIQLRDQLKKSLPLATQYSKIYSEIKAVKDRKKVIMDEFNPVYKQKKILGEQIKVIVEKRKQEEEANPKKKEEGEKKDGEKVQGEKKDGKREPKLDKDGKRIYDDPFSKRIDELYEFKKQQFKKKDTLRDEYESSWDKYFDQQDFIRKIEYIARVKDRLKKIEEVKEKKARAKRLDLIEEYIEKNTPTEDTTGGLREELATTNVLIGYLTSILPSNKRLLAIEDIEDASNINTADLSAQIQGDSKFKGLKLSVKKEPELPFSITNKKKGGKKNKDDKKPAQKEDAPVKQEEDEDVNKKLVFELDIRNSFSLVSIEPPEALKDVEDVIQTLEKKRGHLESEIKNKEGDFETLKKKAEESVPTIEQLKELFKDAPTRDYEEGRPRDRSRKERRGTRGGNQQWRGKGNDKHEKRTGEVEKDQAGPYEEEEEKPVKVDHRKGSRHAEFTSTAADFPTL